MLLISAVLSLIYLYALRLIVKPLLYISFLLIMVLLVAGGVYLFISSDDYPEGDSTRDYMKYGSYVVFGLAALYLIILLCCCSRIKLGIGIMEAASDFSRNVSSVFFIPIVFFLFTLVWGAFWCVSAVYVYSVGEPEKS